MKRFIINILVVTIVSIAVLCGLSIYDATKLQRMGIKVSPDTHIIAFGPSTISCALNEKHLDGFENLSRSGTPYFVLTPLLPKILDDNPQIDTVWLSHGRFQFKQVRDQITKMETADLRDKLPLFFYNPTESPWGELLKNPNFYTILLTPDIYSLKTTRKSLKLTNNSLEDFRFGYLKKETSNLHNNNADWSIAWYEKQLIEDGGRELTKQDILEKRKTNGYWLNKAIEICEQHHVIPVLFFTPLYEYDKWCTNDGFCQDMNPNLLIADYEDFIFPNDSYYADVHHLNSKGADVFTSYIAKHGIRILRLEEWLSEKGY